MKTILLLLFLIPTSCSIEGKWPSKKKTPGFFPGLPDQTADVEDTSTTGLRLLLSPRSDQPSLSCRRPKDVSSPEWAVGLPNIDGIFTEWDDFPAALVDPVSSRPQDTDIHIVKMFRHKGSAYFAIKGDGLLDNSDLYIELGGGAYSDAFSYYEESLRTFKINRSGLFIQVEGEWIEYSDERFSLIADSDNGVELWLSRLLVSESFNWPIWWFRLHTLDSLGQVEDFTSTRYYQSAISRTSQDFRIEGCDPAFYDGSDIHFFEISSDEIPNSVNSGIFSAARFVFSGVRQFFKSVHLPYSHINFIIMNQFNAKTDTDSPNPLKEAKSFHLAVDHFLHIDALGNQSDFNDPWPFRGAMSQLARDIIRFFVVSINSSLSDYLIDAYAVAMESTFTIDAFGMDFWLQQTNRAIEDISLNDGEMDSKQKSFVFGLYLAQFFTPDQILRSVNHPHDNSADDLEVINTLLLFFSDRSVDLSDLKLGWVTDENYSADFAPELWIDGDGDGLPKWLENKAGTTAESVDSDGDGWSDYSEYIYQTDGLQIGSHPDGIIMDGLLGDWQDLAPSRLRTDAGSANEDCAGLGNIDQYAALSNGDALIVAAKTILPLKNSKLAWKIYVDLPYAKKQFMVETNQSERGYKVFSDDSLSTGVYYQVPMMVGGQHLEVVIDREVLGIDQKLDSEGDVSIKIVTFKGADTIDQCDETPWFEPLKSAGDYN